MPTWRLIVDEPAEGVWNMAVDHALLLSRAQGQAPPTLRLYRWSMPTVSLGRFQPQDDVDIEYCKDNAVGLCRRPTGGRGVLHDDELTYAIVASAADGVPRGVRESYRWLCGALAAAYRALGVDASVTARDRGRRSAACYLHATDADLSLGRAKLSGSAQVWMRDTCLQHGSLVISRDVTREARVFRLDGAQARALGDSTATIVQALGRRAPVSDMVAAVVEGVTATLGARLASRPLSADERATARRLCHEYVLGV